jgi:hypothetical protein
LIPNHQQRISNCIGLDQGWLFSVNNKLEYLKRKQDTNIVELNQDMVTTKVKQDMITDFQD